MRDVLLLFLIFFVAIQGWCAERDTLSMTKTDTVSTIKKDRDIPKYVSYLSVGIPVAAITYGALTRKIDWFKSLDRQMDEEVREHWSARIYLDDYLQYLPLVSYFGLDLCGVKAKHRFVERLAVAATANAIMAVTVNVMKKTISVDRPDNRNNNSFPSGHTATAFTGAHLLLREYWGVSPWIGVAGYGVAGTVGVLRMLNKKHWGSDVITGMGIGVLSVELAYCVLPFYQRVFKKKSDHITLLPQFDGKNAGLYFSYRF